ncbi:MAG TPA: hypothetical protein VG228_10095 [Solirubrobacteraceae bacterium]|nr:hypothetical protein [Solirubrobacteraceae bacterium]
MDDLCEVCEADIDTGRDTYTVATPEPRMTANFALCAACAVTLADEIAGNLPDDYLAVLAGAVERRTERVAFRQLALAELAA